MCEVCSMYNYFLCGSTSNKPHTNRHIKMWCDRPSSQVVGGKCTVYDIVSTFLPLTMWRTVDNRNFIYLHIIIIIIINLLLFLWQFIIVLIYLYLTNMIHDSSCNCIMCFIVAIVSLFIVAKDLSSSYFSMIYLL